MKLRKYSAVGETTKLEQLSPDRMAQGDLFICDIFDAAPKADMAGMEHPIFSVSTKPDLTPRKYQNKSLFVEVVPSVKGLATIHDRDVLIFCISQLIAAKNEGRPISKTIEFNASDLLSSTNRPTGGESYRRLKDALERLSGTRITTNVITGGKEELEGFGIIERFKIVRETRDGRMQRVEIKISDWLYNAVDAYEVLTLSRDYFRLRRPLERKLYEIGRKHIGVKARWSISLEALKNKSGSRSSMKEFRRLVGNIVAKEEQQGEFPDFGLEFDGAMLTFINKGSVPLSAEEPIEPFRAPLSSIAYEEARSAAPGWDIYMLETEWRQWCGDEEIEPKYPDRHFVKFCRTWFERRGSP